MSTLAPSHGSVMTQLLEQPPTRNDDHHLPEPRAVARTAPKSPDHVKRKQNPTMSTITSSPTRTTTTPVAETTATPTATTSRLRSLFDSLRRRLRWVPGATDPRVHIDQVHRHYNTVHPMHLR